MNTVSKFGMFVLRKDGKRANDSTKGNKGDIHVDEGMARVWLVAGGEKCRIGCVVAVQDGETSVVNIISGC